MVVTKERRCTCDRYRNCRPRAACEHIFAVDYFIEPPTPDEFMIPADIPETSTPLPATDEPNAAALADVDVRTILRGGYTKHASSYERALQSEFPDVSKLTLEVCKAYAGGEYWKPRAGSKQGRKAFPLWLMLYASFLKVFMKFSLRKTHGFLRMLRDLGYLDIDRVPGFATIGEFLRAPETPPLLNDLIYITASTFKGVGKIRVGGDGTGWSSSRYGDHRLEHRDAKDEARRHEWHRVTAICDVDFFFVLGVFVGPWSIGERAALKTLLPDLKSRGWDIGAFMLDAGFDGTMLRDELVELGYAPYVPYKDGTVNAIAPRHKNDVRHAAELIRCFHLFSQFAEAFREVFRYRVKLEALFSSVKEICGSFVRGRREESVRSEILMMFLVHNIRMIHFARTAIEDHQRRLSESSTRRGSKGSNGTIEAPLLPLSYI
jgi:transposase